MFPPSVGFMVEVNSIARLNHCVHQYEQCVCIPHCPEHPQAIVSRLDSAPDRAYLLEMIVRSKIVIQVGVLRYVSDIGCNPRTIGGRRTIAATELVVAS